MKDRYKYYTDGVGKIIAVSTYAGKVVRGVAKCDPKDEFDMSKGRELAKARCDCKIAEKRKRRAAKEKAKAAAALTRAYEHFSKMSNYFSDASNDVDKMRKELNAILKEF